MTYSIFSLETGNLLDSYATRTGAMNAVASLLEKDSRARSSVALIEFDDDGAIVTTYEGDDCRVLMRFAAPLVVTRDSRTLGTR